jgi:hypothetical protein
MQKVFHDPTKEFQIIESPLVPMDAIFLVPKVNMEALEALRSEAANRVGAIRAVFPDSPDDFHLEIEATTLFREAVNRCKRTFGKTFSGNNMLISPDGRSGSLLAWASPDWELVLYIAKLFLYMAKCGEYERVAFTKEQRANRDEREKRHKALLEKWPVVE